MSSPDDALQGAVTALLAKLQGQEQMVLDTKKTINGLHHHMGKPPMFDLDEAVKPRSTLAIRPDQYYGKPMATMVKEILEAHGQAMSAADIIAILEKGGYDFSKHDWKDKDRLRAFTITLSKNILGFHRLPNGFFGLPAWYPEAIKQKQANKAERNPTQDEDASTGADDLEVAK